MSKRSPIPAAVQTQVLLANRHACCVCQKPRVQIHHIDGNSQNNDLANLAVLCLIHHDMASMTIGLTKKLRPEQVRQYKETWETRCREDMLALARDRTSFYATLYKNPSRNRELFIALSEVERKRAVEQLGWALIEEEKAKSLDPGYQFQQTPRKDNVTLACLASAANGELWPEWLPRVGGHPQDPDYPIDLSPPHGMQAFHVFDLYCQILVRVLMFARSATPLEYLRNFGAPAELKAFTGMLVDFRERSYGKGIVIPGRWKDYPTGSVQFREKRGSFLYRTKMEVRTMYIFSDTSALNLRNSQVCGVGLFGGAIAESKKEIWLRVIPLLIRLGGLGQSDASGWVWTPK